MKDNFNEIYETMKRFAEEEEEAFVKALLKIENPDFTEKKLDELYLNYREDDWIQLLSDDIQGVVGVDWNA